MHPATAQAIVLVDELVRNDVRHIVLCPGSRNAPLAFAAHQADQERRLELHVRIDERSAGFLALGLAKASGKPVVVICTSGTAAANFHPAVTEADRSSVPLIVLTADRPPELRAAGANQVIDQHRLYGGAVRFFDELAVAERRIGQNAYWRTQVCRACSVATGPVHLNVPFREPLGPDGVNDWCESLAGRANGEPWTRVQSDSCKGAVTPSAKRGLVLLADENELALVAVQWAKRHGWPVLSETGGVGYRNVIGAGMWLLGDTEFMRTHCPEQVICVGRPTVFRQVQNLLANSEVLLVSTQDSWPSPGHNVTQVGQAIAEPLVAGDQEWISQWQSANDKVIAALDSTMSNQKWPTGIALAGDLLDALPAQSLLVVGSSNATRDIALAARYRPGVVVLRNRGVAGIDGTVSTAVGAALANTRHTYALLGDLTFLHDLNGLLIGPAERKPGLTIVVFNDNGGGIFSLLEQGAPEHVAEFERVFGTPHNAELAQLCAGYQVPHILVASSNELQEAVTPEPGIRVIEVCGERSGLRDLHNQLREAVTKSLSNR